MKKIRINELARELEVKAHEILDRLPELGVSEKKTHSSSIDEDVAIKLRQYFGQSSEPRTPREDSDEPAEHFVEQDFDSASSAPAVEAETSSPASAPRDTVAE